MVPYLEAALSGKTIHSQKIIIPHGAYFYRLLSVIASDGTNDILGALCIEIDMEDTYRSIERSTVPPLESRCREHDSTSANCYFLFLYKETEVQRTHPAAASGTDRKSSRGSQQGEIDLSVQYVA